MKKKTNENSELNVSSEPTKRVPLKRKALGEITNSQTTPSKKLKHNENTGNSQNSVTSELCASSQESQNELERAGSKRNDGQANILSLACEVSSIIFGHLDHQSQLNLAISCKKLNADFGSSKAMRKIRLVIDLGKLPNNFNLTRNYTNIKLINFSDALFCKKKTVLMNNLMQLSKSVKNLKFSNCRLSQMNLMLIFSLFNEIHDLKMKECNFTEDDDYKQLGFSLINLKTIDVDAVVIFQIQEYLMQCRDLTKVVIREKNHSLFEDDEMCDVFTRIRVLMTKQKNLEFFDIADGQFFEQKLAFPFQLKQLALPIPRMSKQQQENLFDFVLTQKSIKNLTFNIRVDHEEQALINLFNHILKLKSIEDLSVVFYPELSQFEQFIRRSDTTINRSVKKLALNFAEFDDNVDEDDFGEMGDEISDLCEAVAMKYPNLEQIYMNKSHDGYAKQFALLPFNKLKKLQFIEVNHFDMSHISKLKLESLKTVKLTSSNIGNLYQFIFRNQNIEQLFIRVTHFFHNESINDYIKKQQTEELQDFIKFIVMNSNIKRVHLCICGEMEFVDEDLIDDYVQTYAKPGFKLNMCSRLFVK